MTLKVGAYVCMLVAWKKPLAFALTHAPSQGLHTGFPWPHMQLGSQCAASKRTRATSIVSEGCAFRPPLVSSFRSMSTVLSVFQRVWPCKWSSRLTCHLGQNKTMPFENKCNRCPRRNYTFYGFHSFFPLLWWCRLFFLHSINAVFSDWFRLLFSLQVLCIRVFADRFSVLRKFAIKLLVQTINDVLFFLGTLLHPVLSLVLWKVNFQGEIYTSVTLACLVR